MTNAHTNLSIAIRRFQEQNRFVGDAYGTGLSLLESRVLTDISSLDNISSFILAKKLNISPTKISRVILSLHQKGLIKKKIDTKDSRRYFLLISTKGEQILSIFDNRADQLLNTFVKRLSEDQRTKVTLYFNNLADGMKVPHLGYSRSEHFLRPAIRRITQGLGLLSDNVIGSSKLSSIEWHILWKLKEQENSIMSKTLVNAYALPANTVAGIIKRLVKRNLITKKVDSKDARQFYLKLTSEGNKLILDTSHKLEILLKNALPLLTDLEIDEFAELLMLMLGVSKEDLLSPDGVLLNIRKIETPEDLTKARAFCAEHYVRLGKAEQIQEIFFTQSSQSYILEGNSELYVAIEFQDLGNNTARSVKDPSFSILHLAHRKELDGSPLIDKFVSNIQQLLVKNFS